MTVADDNLEESNGLISVTIPTFAWRTEEGHKKCHSGQSASDQDLNPGIVKKKQECYPLSCDVKDQQTN